MPTTTARPWQQTILDELGDAQLNDDVADTDAYAAVWVPADLNNEDAELLGTGPSEIAAIVIAEDKAATRTGGEARVIKLDDLAAWSKAHAAGDATPELDGPKIEPKRQNVEPDEDDATDSDASDEDAKPEETPEPKPGEQAKAFDASQYDREDLQIPKVDGQTIDRISLKFSGEVFLDRSEPSDVAVYNAFRLGKDVALLIEAKCSSTAAKGATDRDGDLDVVVGTKGLKVHSLSKPSGADWVQDA